MSSSNPPYPYYNGITYNNSFFTTNTGSGLSQAKANTLYLQKTTTDTATALETFTGGIKTNSIDTVASTDNLTINSGTGNTTLGASSGTVYIGSAQVGLGSIIQLGTSVTTARVAGSISTPSIYPSTASGTLTIGNDGLNTISIGGSSGRTAPISIGTGSSTANGTVLISNNANSTSSIKIGDGSGQSSNIFIGSNNATAPASTFNNVLIGASNKSLYLNGSIYMNDGGGSLTMGSSGTSYISLGAMNTTFNIGGPSSPFNLSSPIKPQYSISFTSDQIGYSSTASTSATLVSGVYNTTVLPAMTGVYMISAKSYVYSPSGFVGITSYDMQLGLNGISERARSFLDGSTLNYANYHQSLAWVYSSGGTPNPTGAAAYGTVQLTFASSSSTPIFGLNIYWTRVA
jgi:hypothetical protein